MQIRVVDKENLSEGDLALPDFIKLKMGLRAGDLLEAYFEISEDAPRLILSPVTEHHYEAKIIEDPLTGWPVLDPGPDAPVLTNEQVLEMLADFP